MKASVKNNSGLMLIVPKYGNGLMLLLEWVASKKGCKIEKVIDDKGPSETMSFRLNQIAEGYVEALEYINSNI